MDLELAVGGVQGDCLSIVRGKLETEVMIVTII